MDSSEQLGRRLVTRDESALDDVYALYGPTLLAYLRRLVGHDEAEDALQRTLLDVWRNAHRYDPNQRLTSWLFTIAHRRAIDVLRTRRHQVVDVEALRHVAGDDGRETAERFADAAEVQAALGQLPEHERETLHLAYFDDLSHRQIAERLDVPVGTVKARASRGTKRLAQLLAATGAK